MTDDERDLVGCPTCGCCIHFNVRADLDGVESTCKRIDHKHFKFSTPFFKSYDCGQFQRNTVCRDFYPKDIFVQMKKNWTSFDDYYGEIPEKDTVGICIDGNTRVRYRVLRRDFVNNDFLDEEGNLKWVCKEYYKRNNTKTFPYELVKEYRGDEAD